VRRNTAPRNLDEALAGAVGGRRVTLRRGGKRYAIVSGDDLARLEAADAAEDADLLAVSLDAEAEWQASGQPATAWLEVKRRAGLA